MILAATRDAARLFLELGTVTIVLAVGTRLAARTGFSSIPLYLVAGIVLGALAPPTLDDALVATLSEVGIVALLFTLGLEYSAEATAENHLHAGRLGGQRRRVRSGDIPDIGRSHVDSMVIEADDTRRSRVLSADACPIPDSS
jgi:hypothetical protein